MPLCRLQHAKYAEYMRKICRHMHKKHKMCAEICSKYAANMLLHAKICTKSALLRHQHAKHAEHAQFFLQKYAKKNAEITHKICRICISLCNIHIYALPTLLML